MIFRYLTLLIVAYCCVIPCNLHAQTIKSNIVFEDNFEQINRIPDIEKWSLCGNNTSNWAKYLSESNDQAFIENGTLIITAEKVGGVYKTGGIQTKGKFDFKHGKVEVNAKLIMAKGAWPAIWMMPTDGTGGWPTCGEIDIMEQLNHDSYIYQTIHNHYKNDLGFTTPMPTKTAYYNVNEFNTYAIDWSDEKIIFSVNGIVSFTYPNLHLTNEETMKQWPYNKPFYLILNCALGGAGTWPGIITDSELPARMVVDWVKVTQEEFTDVEQGTTLPLQISMNNGKLKILNSVNDSQMKIFNTDGQLLHSFTLNGLNCSLNLPLPDKLLIVQIGNPNGIRDTFKIFNN